MMITFIRRQVKIPRHPLELFMLISLDVFTQFRTFAIIQFNGDAVSQHMPVFNPGSHLMRRAVFPAKVINQRLFPTFMDLQERYRIKAVFSAIMLSMKGFGEMAVNINCLTISAVTSQIRQIMLMIYSPY